MASFWELEVSYMELEQASSSLVACANIRCSLPEGVLDIDQKVVMAVCAWGVVSQLVACALVVVSQLVACALGVVSQLVACA